MPQKIKDWLWVQYEAGMGMGDKRFRSDRLDDAIAFAETVGGTVYRVEELWSVWGDDYRAKIRVG